MASQRTRKGPENFFWFSASFAKSLRALRPAVWAVRFQLRPKWYQSFQQEPTLNFPTFRRAAPALCALIVFALTRLRGATAA